MEKKKPVVDQNLCIGCGLCASLCPEVFELDEDTYKSKVKANVSEFTPSVARCQNAIDSCPVAAISWNP
ncbi:MAG: ferredoxin [bacterium]